MFNDFPEDIFHHLFGLRSQNSMKHCARNLSSDVLLQGFQWFMIPWTSSPCQSIQKNHQLEGRWPRALLLFLASRRDVWMQTLLVTPDVPSAPMMRNAHGVSNRRIWKLTKITCKFYPPWDEMQYHLQKGFTFWGLQWKFILNFSVWTIFSTKLEGAKPEKVCFDIWYAMFTFVNMIFVIILEMLLHWLSNYSKCFCFRRDDPTDPSGQRM